MNNNLFCFYIINGALESYLDSLYLFLKTVILSKLEIMPLLPFIGVLSKVELSK